MTGEFCHLTGREEVRSKDGIRWRHWPVAEVRLRAAELVCVHLNRNKLTFDYDQGFFYLLALKVEKGKMLY